MYLITDSKHLEQKWLILKLIIHPPLTEPFMNSFTTHVHTNTYIWKLSFLYTTSKYKQPKCLSTERHNK